jgi:hypothetical protein
LVATAILYSRVIQTIGFEPELQKEEIDAIQVGLDECIKRYGGDFSHWPAVMLIMALTSPIAVRLPGYIERKRNLQPHEKIVNHQNHQEKENGDRRTPESD